MQNLKQEKTVYNYHEADYGAINSKLKLDRAKGKALSNEQWNIFKKQLVDCRAEYVRTNQKTEKGQIFTMDEKIHS